MKILFVHPNFPGQFLHLAAAVGRHPAHQAAFLSAGGEGQLEGVLRGQYRKGEPSLSPHPYIKKQEERLTEGLVVAGAARALRERGFEPDVVYSHPAWGSSLFLREVFPAALHVAYCEWFMKAQGQYLDYGEALVTPDEQCALRTDQAAFMLSLLDADIGIAPFAWQKAQFPKEIQAKIQVLPDGVDTERYAPDVSARGRLKEAGLRIPEDAELVTYVSRGMETLRGFPQFAAALAWVQRQRPNCHAVLVGSLAPAYAKTSFDAKQCLIEAGADLRRVHFTGLLPRFLYRCVLQASDVHVYLTKPFVLSWSFMEALSCGCAVVASATPPVEEVLEDGYTGWTVPFAKPDILGRRVVECLENKEQAALVRRRARALLVERFSLRKVLPMQLSFLQQWVNRIAKG